MGFRFWRRIKIAPGVTLNLSNSGGSLSFGPRGAKFTIGSRGKRATIGLPGTGLFYTSTFPSKKRTKHGKGNSGDYAPTVRPEDRLTLGFFKRLFEMLLMVFSTSLFWQGRGMLVKMSIC